MAAALFNQHAAGGGWQARSAGIAAVPDQPSSEHAVQAMAELYQIKLDGHRSSLIEPSDLDQSSWILTMTTQQRDLLRMQFQQLQERIYTINEFAGEPERDIVDPYGHDLACYQTTVMQIASLIDKIWRKLTGSARK